MAVFSPDFDLAHLSHARVWMFYKGQAWNKFAFQGTERCADRMTGTPKLTNDLDQENEGACWGTLHAPPRASARDQQPVCPKCCPSLVWVGVWIRADWQRGRAGALLTQGVLYFQIPHSSRQSLSNLGKTSPIRWGHILCMSLGLLRVKPHNKVHIVKAMVFPVVIYGCENWTIKKSEHQR